MNTFVRPLIILFLFIGPAAGVETPFLDSGSRDHPRNDGCQRGQIECGYRTVCQRFSANECIGCLEGYKVGGPSGCYKCSEGTVLAYEGGQWVCKKP